MKKKNSIKTSALHSRSFWEYMQKRSKICLAGLLACICVIFSGCGSQKSEGKWEDGYYTAIMDEYSHGWKEYVTICVMNNKIVSVEFNARNPSGFIKAWDNAYMKNMNPVSGTYPNRYTRTYAAELLADQSADDIDMIAGASSSGGNFRRLAAAVLECAKKGDTEIAVVATEQE